MNLSVSESLNTQIHEMNNVMYSASLSHILHESQAEYITHSAVNLCGILSRLPIY